MGVKTHLALTQRRVRGAGAGRKFARKSRGLAAREESRLQLISEAATLLFDKRVR